MLFITNYKFINYNKYKYKVVNCVEQVTGKSIDTVKVDGGVTKS